MKIAVFSDSHGWCADMISAVRLSAPDLIVHLGDGSSDAQELFAAFPEVPHRAVRGNCDMASPFPDTDVFLADDVTVFITHGHRYRVKSGTDSLLNAAHFSGASLVLFGHTHRAEFIRAGGMYVLNPGSSGRFRNPSYALVDIGVNGAISHRHIRLDEAVR